MAEQEERLEHSLALVRRLIAEVRRHEDDYHCRTNEGLLREAEEFLCLTAESVALPSGREQDE